MSKNVDEKRELLRKGSGKLVLRMTALSLMLASCGGGSNSNTASVNNQDVEPSLALSNRTVVVKKGLADDDTKRVLEVTFSEEVTVLDESHIKIVRTTNEKGETLDPVEVVSEVALEVVKNQILLTFSPLQNSSYKVVFQKGSLADKNGNVFVPLTASGGDETQEFTPVSEVSEDLPPDNNVPNAPNAPKIALEDGESRQVGKLLYVKDSRPTFVVILENAEIGGKVTLYHNSEVVGETIVSGSNVAIKVQVNAGKLEDAENITIRAEVMNVAGKRSDLSAEGVAFVLDTKPPNFVEASLSAEDKTVIFYFDEAIELSQRSLDKLSSGLLYSFQDNAPLSLEIYGVRAAGSQLTFTFLDDVNPVNGKYFLRLADDVVKDLAGNSVTGTSDFPFFLDWVAELADISEVYDGTQSLTAEIANDFIAVKLRLHFTKNLSSKGVEKDQTKLMRKLPGGYDEEIAPTNYKIAIENSKELVFSFNKTLVSKHSEEIFYVELEKGSVMSEANFLNTDELISSAVVIDRKEPQIMEGRKIDARKIQVKFSEPILYGTTGEVYLQNETSEKFKVEVRVLDSPRGSLYSDTIELLSDVDIFAKESDYFMLYSAEGVFGDRSEPQNVWSGGSSGEQIIIFAEDELSSSSLDWDSLTYTLTMGFLGIEKSSGTENFMMRWVQKSLNSKGQFISDEALAEKISVVRDGESTNRVASASLYEGELVIKLKKLEGDNGLAAGDVLDIQVQNDALTDVWGEKVVSFLDQVKELDITFPSLDEDGFFMAENGRFIADEFYF